MWFRKNRKSAPQVPQPQSQPASDPQQPIFFSEWSTPAVPASAWCSEDFMLGAGMVIIQPSTHKLVIIYETQRKFWFLPKGRKDLGESLEQAALREAYEESGYRVEPLPLYTYNHAPSPPNDPDAYARPNTEPIFITLNHWRPRKHLQFPVPNTGGEYLTAWYVGQIPENAVREEGSGMPDEQNYVAYLSSYDDAVHKLRPKERRVVEYAWALYIRTFQKDAQLREERERQ